MKINVFKSNEIKCKFSKYHYLIIEATKSDLLKCKYTKVEAAKSVKTLFKYLKIQTTEFDELEIFENPSNQV